MNVYIQELKMSWKSMVYWTIGLLAALTFFMTMFSSISKDAAVMQEILSKFPPQLVKALGMSSFDLSSFLGYYSFLFTFLVLIASIYAMKSGISVLSEEARAKTSDFLLVKPIKRTTIVTAKIMSVLTNVLIQNVIYIIASFIIANTVADQSYDKGTLLLINISMLSVQLFFIALGLFLSVIMKRLKTVLPVTLGIVFGFLVLFMLYQTLSDSKLAYITPFAYFDVAYTLAAKGFKTNLFILDIILVLAFIALTYIIYNKKDMPSV
jgi:ABC-2 type transport system permease protein